MRSYIIQMTDNMWIEEDCQKALANFRTFCLLNGGLLRRRVKLKWLQSNSRPEMRENGDVVWYGVLFDISDRKQAEIETDRS